jgi:hypothetical protein
LLDSARGPFRRVVVQRRARPDLRTLGLVAAIGAVLVAAGLIARHSERTLDRDTSSVWVALAPSGPGRTGVKVSVTNRATAASRFRVEVSSGARRSSFPLSLAPGEAWSSTTRVKRAAGGAVTVRIFAAGSTVPARTVSLR